jgi:hypothetical protein
MLGVDRPLKGFYIRDSIRKQMKEDKISVIIGKGKRNYTKAARNKIDLLLGLPLEKLNVSEEFRERIDNNLMGE